MKHKHPLLLASFLLGIRILSAQDWTPKRIVAMEYPSLAAQSRTEGKVEIKCLLDTEGQVIGTEIISVSGPKPARGLLGKAAQENASRWRFFKKSKKALSPNKEAILVYTFKLGPVVPDKIQHSFIFEYPDSVLVTSDTPEWMP